MKKSSEENRSENHSVSQSVSAELDTGGQSIQFNKSTKRFEDKRNESNAQPNPDSSSFSQSSNNENAQLISQNRRASNDAIQLKTKIYHSTKAFTYNHEGENRTEPVGSTMEAYLDPFDPVKGSATQKNGPQGDLLKAVKSHGTHSMVRGHLLNHDLGGFGVSDNLYPITSGANNKHKSYAENPVQSDLFDAHKAGDQAGKGVYYKVSVNPIHTSSESLSSNNSTFNCEAYLLNGMTPSSVGKKGAKTLGVSIDSTPEKSGRSSDAWNHDGSDLVGSSDKKVTKGWAHGGREGEEDFELYKTAGKINTSEEWTTLKKVLLGAGIGLITILVIGGYLYYNPDKLPAFMRAAKSGAEGLGELAKKEGLKLDL